MPKIIFENENLRLTKKKDSGLSPSPQPAEQTVFTLLHKAYLKDLTSKTEAIETANTMPLSKIWVDFN